MRVETEPVKSGRTRPKLRPDWTIKHAEQGYELSSYYLGEVLLLEEEISLGAQYFFFFFLTSLHTVQLSVLTL